MKLSTKESLALQAMIKRVGFAAVLDDLAMLAGEKDDDEWQRIAAELGDLRNAAGELEV
jgi:hypothetical protein